MKAFLRSQYVRFCRLYSHLTLLHQYGSDGTPAQYLKREHRMLHEERVVRAGKQSFESYNQRSTLFCVDGSDVGQYAKLFRDPLLLGRHTCEILVAVWSQFDACPRHHGHRGLLVEGYCWDGAVFDRMRSLVGGWTCLMCNISLRIQRTCYVLWMRLLHKIVPNING